MKTPEGLYLFNLFVMNKDNTVNRIVTIQVRSYTAGDVTVYRYGTAVSLLSEEGIKNILDYLNPDWNNDMDLAIPLTKFNEFIFKYGGNPYETES